MRKSINMSRRGFIRLISLLTAALVAFAIMSAVYHRRNVMAKRHIEVSYLRSLESLSSSIESIKTSLNKGVYSNSPQMMNNLSGRLSAEASSAKASLAQLPVTELNLEKTNRFLSQVGNYAHSLASNFAGGQEMKLEERENLLKLLDYAETLSSEIWSVESMVSGGHLTFEEVVQNSGQSGNTAYPAHVSDGFSSVEDGFEDYPELTYDGPFSDHILKQEPMMLKGTQAVSRENSLETAKRVSGSEHMSFDNEQEGRIPSYVYSDGSATVSITQNGGFFVYMLRNRDIGEKTISVDKAIDLAASYLDKIGYKDMVQTYYELNGGICTVNFAGFADGVTVYTDLIKVEVALDDGEITSFDARGFVTAHHERNKAEEIRRGLKVTQEEAASKISPHLEIKHSKLAVIPSAGENERLCHEFLCNVKNGDKIETVLIYINAETGAEEQILLMRTGDNGTFVV